MKDKAFVEVSVNGELTDPQIAECEAHMRRQALREVGFKYAERYATSKEWWEVDWFEGDRLRVERFEDKVAAKQFHEYSEFNTNLTKKIRYTLG